MSVPPRPRSWSQLEADQTIRIAGQGFGDGQAPAKTYGQEASLPIRDMTDTHEAMSAFFASREEWLPLFRTMATDATCEARTFLGKQPLETESDEATVSSASTPWRTLPAIPDDPQDKSYLAEFLDAMHQSLLAIPTTESRGEEEDENDVQFLEEGRRMLAINRFHVLREDLDGSVESYDALFSTCWSEVRHLSASEEEHTGSIILVPGYQLPELRRFTDMNLLRPLEWLGVSADFEVVSMQRGSPAIRLLYKLNDMPEDHDTEEQGED